MKKTWEIVESLVFGLLAVIGILLLAVVVVLFTNGVAQLVGGAPDSHASLIVIGIVLLLLAIALAIKHYKNLSE